MGVSGREKDLAWRGNSYFLKAGHDLGRGKPNVARASKLMHDTRLEPLSSSGNPLHSKGDNQKRTMGHGDHPTVLQRTQRIQEIGQWFRNHGAVRGLENQRWSVSPPVGQTAVI